ncbi:MAG: Hpt domain-containing protein [Campylobacterales bacterium]|nr:Hpt domain-containing protein [Campylobacterales bacterium]
MDQSNIFYDEIINKLNVMEFVINDTLSDPTNDEKINELFRSVHTIKGIANLLFFFEIENLTHKAEDLLDEVRHKRLQFTNEVANLFRELKNFLVILVDEKLDGLDMDEFEEDQYKDFERKFIQMMPKTILVLDSSYELKEMIDLEATKFKTKVVTASNAYDAQKLLEQNNIQLVMINISDLELKGKEFLDYYYMQHENSNFPIVLISDKKDDYLMKCGGEYKAKAWLLKDCTPQQIEAILQKFI